MPTEYLTTHELAARNKCDPRTSRERLMDSALIEGLHYMRRFGGRKILYGWNQIVADIGKMPLDSGPSIGVQPLGVRKERHPGI